MLKDAGFDRPPKTQDEFLAICRKIKADGGKDQSAYSFSWNIFTSILPWFYESALKNDNSLSLPEIDWDSRASIEAFTFLNLLYKEKLVGGETLDKTDDELINDFLSGKTAMITGPSTFIKEIEKLKPGLLFNVTAIPPPANYRGRPVFNLSVFRIGIVENSEKKQEAALFSAFIKEKQNEITSSTGAIPGTLSDTLERGGANDALSLVFEKTRDLYEGSIVIDESKIFQEPRLFQEIFKEELQKMWAGEQTPAECAATIATKEDAATAAKSLRPKTSRTAPSRK
jgi:ABC-type glycerol-3-phosphate transport system substrate-binding protein